MEGALACLRYLFLGMQGQQAAKSGIDTAHGQAKAGVDQAAGTAASQVCVPVCVTLHQPVVALFHGVKGGASRSRRKASLL